jgi:SAM-dependent methyltransferase
MLFEAMPFESESIDLVVMPHSLEVSEDPHALLREIYRILIPGGRIILTGFNLMSLWGLRFKMQRFGAKTFLPGRQFMSVFQIRDWLHLLSFHVDRGAFGCYGLTFSSPQSREDSWIEKAGDRWWPQCGAIFAISATKEVAGCKLVGRAVNKKFFFLGRRPAPKSE